jgi:cellulose synthase/poly-beta-1,6-N-acetylglucosamine synthase-like glycosyltransferase
MAYNEEANIGRLLEALLSQRLQRVKINEIIVVASGCTDATEAIVSEFAQRTDQVRLLRQPRREGKASAINLLLNETQEEVIVLHSADTMPTPQTIERLVEHFADPQVGMVGGRPMPINSPDDFMGFAVHMLWELHHQMSLRYPKMGELVAFRRIFRQIPHDTPVDEASIEPLIRGQGYGMRYEPKALVYNKGPETLSDFIKQRRRIYAGHLYIVDMLGYHVSTMNGLAILNLFLKSMRPTWRHFIWGPAVVALEALTRLLGTWDYTIRKSKPFAWPIVESTKMALPDIRETA